MMALSAVVALFITNFTEVGNLNIQIFLIMYECLNTESDVMKETLQILVTIVMDVRQGQGKMTYEHGDYYKGGWQCDLMYGGQV